MSNPSENIAARVAGLERELRRMKLFALVGTIVLGVAATLGFRSQQPDVIRTRGIVVVDSAGRERILIGAPIPFARNRVRTDTARVARVWAPRYPNPRQYMGYYASYRHSVHGMLVMDENGFDRVAIGDSTPDPNIGKRIGAAVGVEINDEQGFERTGYGLLKVNGNYRVVLGLDSKEGREGAALSLFDEGGVGLTVYGPGGRRAAFGRFPPVRALGLTDTVQGLILTRGNELRRVISTDDKP